MTPDSAVAVLSDVQGNLTAFRAVLGDIERRGIRTVVNLGDIAGKGPRGAECVELSLARCAPIVQGNWEAILVPDSTDDEWPALHWWRDEVGGALRRRLADLPLAAQLEVGRVAVRFVHASAESVFTRVFADHTDAEFDAMFAATALTGPGPVPQVVCYGDIHYAYARAANGRMLVNVGSVGNALDEPTACYAVLSPAGSAYSTPIQVEFVRVEYDIEAEIAKAEALGMPELAAYAGELRTARYRRG